MTDGEVKKAIVALANGLGNLAIELKPLTQCSGLDVAESTRLTRAVELATNCADEAFRLASRS